MTPFRCRKDFSVNWKWSQVAVKRAHTIRTHFPLVKKRSYHMSGLLLELPGKQYVCPSSCLG